MERLNHEIALLEMRTEQLRIHLRSVRSGNPEARKVRSVLSAMRTKMRALQAVRAYRGRDGSWEADAALDGRACTIAAIATATPPAVVAEGVRVGASSRLEQSLSGAPGQVPGRIR